MDYNQLRNQDQALLEAIRQRKTGFRRCFNYPLSFAEASKLAQLAKPPIIIDQDRYNTYKRLQTGMFGLWIVSLIALAFFSVFLIFSYQNYILLSFSLILMLIPLIPLLWTRRDMSFTDGPTITGILFGIGILGVLIGIVMLGLLVLDLHFGGIGLFVSFTPIQWLPIVVIPLATMFFEALLVYWDRNVPPAMSEEDEFRLALRVYMLRCFDDKNPEFMRNVADRTLQPFEEFKKSLRDSEGNISQDIKYFVVNELATWYKNHWDECYENDFVSSFLLRLKQTSERIENIYKINMRLFARKAGSQPENKDAPPLRRAQLGPNVINIIAQFVGTEQVRVKEKHNKVQGNEVKANKDEKEETKGGEPPRIPGPRMSNVSDVD
ncbi:MAG: MFS transporter [Gammaproteobacteria bacterium]|nr:MFS transporter [Gammaproteobacteria bacterium]